MLREPSDVSSKLAQVKDKLETSNLNIQIMERI